jgi:AraC family transcriptional regulator
MAVITDNPGVIEVPGQPNPRLVIHVGKRVRVVCTRGDDSRVGATVHGDIDIVPAGVASRCEIYGIWRAQLLSVSGKLLQEVAASSGLDASRFELQNRLKIRNPQMEHIGWALRAEAEQGYPGGRIYMESMATALAVEMLHNRGLRVENGRTTNSSLSSRRLNQVLAYIDDNLGDDLTLQAIAEEAGIGISLLRQMFRKSIGMPLYQYIIHRRVERAADLLTRHNMPINQIALETGFSHQSHLAMHMRRVLGVSPNDLRKSKKTRCVD